MIFLLYGAFYVAESETISVAISIHKLYCKTAPHVSKTLFEILGNTTQIKFSQLKCKSQSQNILRSNLELLAEGNQFSINFCNLMKSKIKHCHL